MPNRSRSVRITLIGSLLLLIVGSMIFMATHDASRPSPLQTTSSTRPATSPASQPLQPWTVSMSPVGSVTFTRVPQRIVTLDANYNDMLVAAGQHHHLIATGYANNRYEGYYEALPNADTHIDPRQFTYLTGAAGAGSGSFFDKETLYSLHGDIHHIDPLQLAHSRNWSPADVQEIAHNVGPFFANRYSRSNDYTGPEKYEYYGVWELSEKVAQVYRQDQRLARLKAVYDDMLARIAAKLPPVSERPRVGLVMYSKTGFLPYNMDQGFGAEQYRAVGAVDAFASIRNMAYKDGGGGTRLDIEGMLSIDPDVLITPFAILPGMRSNHEQLLALRDDPLGKRLKAFRNNRVYPGGTPLQGPLFLLFQVEMAAKQIYPEQFGPYRDDQRYPKEEQLFDREKVSQILNDKSGGAIP